MKYLKTYEYVSERTKNDDYVIINRIPDTYGFTEKLKEYFSKNVGIVKSIKGSDKYYNVYFENVPGELRSDLFYIYNGYREDDEDDDKTTFNQTVVVTEKEILYWSNDKEELEAFVLAKKFNI